MIKKKFSKYITLLSAMMILITSLFTVPVSAAAQAAVPSKVVITKVASTGSGSVSINWKKSGNVTKYCVYYKKYGASRWIKVADVSSAKTAYTHKSSKKAPLTAGKKYVYTVRGYNSKTGKWGVYNKSGVPVVVKNNNNTTYLYMVHLVNGKGGAKHKGNGYYYWDTGITSASTSGNTITFNCSFTRRVGNNMSTNTFLKSGKRTFRITSKTKYYFSDMYGREYTTLSHALQSVNRKNGLVLVLKVSNNTISDLYFCS